MGVSDNTIVIIKKNDNFEFALKRFMKKCSKSGILYEARKRMYFEKPSEQRRRKKMESIRRAARELIEDQEQEYNEFY